MDDIALVVLQILNGNHRGNELVARTEVVELATIEWNDSHAEFFQFLILDTWVLAQGATEL